MAGKAKSQKSLDNWTKQKWTTASCIPFTQGPKASGDVYAPAAKIKRLKSTPAGRKKLAAANRKKRAATRAGKQRANHGLHKKKKTNRKKK